VLLPEPDTGFVLLAVRPASFVKTGRLFTAEDAASLHRLWRDLEIAGPVPQVDFAVQVVLLFAEYDTCHGGNGWSPLRRLLVHADGSTEPEFVRAREVLCEESLVRFVPTVLYALAVRRELVERHAGRVLRLAPARVVWVARSPLAASVAATCVAPPPAPSFCSGESSILSVGELGTTTLQYLDDGTPVFVVRHADGTLDVLASDAPSVFDVLEDRDTYPLRGLRDQVRWDCGSRMFVSPAGAYDEYGIPVLALRWASLDRYRTVRSGETSVLVAPDGRMRGYGPRRPMAPDFALGAYVTGGPQIEPYAAVPQIDLTAASARRVGTRVLVAADLALGDGSSPRLCDRAQPSCSGARIGAAGVAWSRPDGWSLRGPFAARVREAGLSDLTSRGAYYAPELLEGGARWLDWRFPKLEGTVSSFGAVGSGYAAMGAEGSLSVVTSPWPAQSVLRILAGADAGIALRGRWFASTQAGQPRGGDYRVGVAPVLENSDVWRDWSYPSPLGVVLPEVGVGVAAAGAFPYLGWSLPVEYYVESPRLRRHPFEVRDVLGGRIAPTVLLSFRRGSSDALYGVAAGVTLW
jgi:hypothetical protein